MIPNAGACRRHAPSTGGAIRFLLQSPLAWGAAALVFAFFWVVASPTAPTSFWTHAELGTDISEALAADDWQFHSRNRSLGYRDGPVWLRWEVPEDASEVIVLHNAWVDNFRLYFVRDGRVLAAHTSGGNHPASERLVAHSEFIFPLPQRPRPSHVYILDHNSTAPVLYPASFETWDSLLRHASALHAGHGLFYGIALIMLIYNLVIYFSVGDRAYLYLVLYAGSLMTLLATSDGFGQFYLWSQSAWIQNTLVSLTMAGVVVFLGEFCRAFLATEQHTPLLSRALRAAQVLMVANTVLILAVDNEYSAMLEPLLVLGFAAVLLTIGVWRSLQGSAAAQIFLAANGIVCVFGSVVALTHLGWIPDSPLGRQAALVGAALELALLSFALARRLKNQERLREILADEASSLSRQVEELKAASNLAEEHRQLQRSMQHQQKLKTIGQLAGGIAHDFNNILATILGFAELALDKSEDRHKQQRYLEEIRDAGERGAALVKQLITYSRGDHGRAAKLDLNSAVSEAATLLRGSLPTTVTVTATLPERHLSAVLDATQLKQVLVNLCLNASEAMANRGTITLSLRSASPQSLQCSSCLNRFSGEFAVVSVADQGQGFEGRTYELFTPFYSTKPVGRGSGLGLSVVHGIVHEHGGHIHATSAGEEATGAEAGDTPRGSRFEVYLPLAEASGRSKAPRQHILLIEDDQAMARYLEALLAEQGYEVTSVGLPTTALETFMADPDVFDLVITDQVMPHGTGLELAQDLLELRPELPIILTTGNPDALSQSAVRHSGVKAVFGKPIQSEALMSKIRGLLTAS